MNKKLLIIPVIIIILVGFWFVTASWRTKTGQNYLQIGDQFLGENQPQKAIWEFKKALLLLPRNSEIAFKIGSAYETAGDLENGQKYFQKAQKYNPKEAKYYLELAENLQAQNKIEKAISFLLEGIERADKKKDLEIFLAKIYFSQNQLTKAEKYFSEADSDYYLGVLSAFKGDYGEAADKIENSSTENASQMGQALGRILKVSNEATKKVILGQALNQTGDAMLGAVILKEVAQNNPDYRDAWVFLGYSYLALENYQEAEKVLLSALDLDPIYPLTYGLLAKVYQGKGDSQKAQEFSLKAKQFESK